MRPIGRQQPFFKILLNKEKWLAVPIYRSQKHTTVNDMDMAILGFEPTIPLFTGPVVFISEPIIHLCVS